MTDVLEKIVPLKEFWLAVRTNDIHTLRELCKDVNLPTFDDSYCTNHLLQKAMRQKASIEVLRFLVDHGVDPHKLPHESGTGTSPLHQAVVMQRLDYIDFILDYDVDPNHGLIDYRDTLSAIGSSVQPATQIEILKRLIAKNVDLNFIFPLFGDMSKGFTVLDHAWSDDAKDFLRSHGAKTAAELRSESATA